MDKVTIVLQDAPYGNEKVWNALRLSEALLAVGTEVRIFLYGDSVVAAKKGQTTPTGYYNIGDMMGMVLRAGAEVGVCGTCIDARGIAETDLVQNAHRSTMDELTAWTQWADKVLVF